MEHTTPGTQIDSSLVTERKSVDTVTRGIIWIIGICLILFSLGYGFFLMERFSEIMESDGLDFKDYRDFLLGFVLIGGIVLFWVKSRTGYVFALLWLAYSVGEVGEDLYGMTMDPNQARPEWWATPAVAAIVFVMITSVIVMALPKMRLVYRVTIYHHVIAAGVGVVSYFVFKFMNS